VKENKDDVTLQIDYGILYSDDYGPQTHVLLTIKAITEGIIRGGQKLIE
jgi:hypothetical protein